MKLQVSLVPELILDALLLIVVTSFTFGTFILYSEFKIIIANESKRDQINFAEVIKGDKCVLSEIDGIKIKGIFDYEKVRNRDFCVNGNFTIEINNERIDFGSGCSKSIYEYPIVLKSENNFLIGKLKVC
jgi:hypothetical protein